MIGYVFSVIGMYCAATWLIVALCVLGACLRGHTLTITTFVWALLWPAAVAITAFARGKEIAGLRKAMVGLQSPDPVLQALADAQAQGKGGKH